MFALVLSLVVLAAPERAKLIELISAKPVGMCGTGDPVAVFHRTPHPPETNRLLMSLVDDATLSAEQRTSAFIALRNQGHDEAVVNFMRARYAKTIGVERHVAAALLVDVSANDRELVLRDFDTGDREFDYAVLNELGRERSRTPLTNAEVERINAALKKSNDEYLRELAKRVLIPAK